MVDINIRESEDLRGASVSNYAVLGGLPDTETIQQEIESEAIRNFAKVFDIPREDVQDFAENNGN